MKIAVHRCCLLASCRSEKFSTPEVYLGFDCWALGSGAFSANEIGKTSAPLEYFSLFPSEAKQPRTS